QLEYWTKQLKDLETLQLPTDHARPQIQTVRGASQRITIEESLFRTLRDIAGRQGATLYMVLLAGFVALLHRYTGQREIVIGTPIANRNRPELESLIGLFVNMLVLRMRVHEEM